MAERSRPRDQLGAETDGLIVKPTASTVDHEKVLRSRHSDAGQSADAHFQNSLAAWRRRVVRRVQPYLLLPASMLFVAQVVWGKDVVSWGLGLGVGAIATFWMWVRDSPPAHIEHWRTGRDAERRTAKALERLARAGWAVAHDVASDRGNRDHIVVGPGGVFLVDTKHLGGVASVRGEVVCVERPDNPRGAYEIPNLASAIRRDAARLSEELRRLTGERVWVDAVVVFWNDFPAAAVEADRVAFIGGRRATSWFDQQPERLSQARVDELRAAIAALPSAA